MPSSNDINSTFGDQWGLSLLLYVSGTCLDLLLYGLGLLRFDTIQVWDWSHFGTIQVQFGVLKFWSFGVVMSKDEFHIEYYTGFGSSAKSGVPRNCI